MIKRRVDGVKDDMCTSLFSNVSGGNRDDNNYLDQDDDMNKNGGDLMEKPVRALRKVLKCGMESSNVMNSDRTSRSNNNSSSILDSKNVNGQSETNSRKKNTIEQQGTHSMEKRKSLNRGHNSNAVDDELIDVPVLTNNPIFVKSKSVSGSKPIDVEENNMQERKRIPRDTEEEENDSILRHQKM